MQHALISAFGHQCALQQQQQQQQSGDNLVNLWKWKGSITHL
jgi:hypothetical protein